MVCCVSPMPLSNPSSGLQSPQKPRTQAFRLRALLTLPALRPPPPLASDSPLHPPFYSCTRHLLTVFPQFRLSLKTSIKISSSKTQLQ